MPVIKATVTRASNGTVDLRPVDPDATDVEFITLAVPNSHEMTKRFQPDSIVEVNVPEGKKKAAAVEVVIAGDAVDTTSPSKKKK